MLITLRELCEKVGVSRRSVQCYEKAGLMRAQGKNKYGHLLYGEESVEMAERIHFLQQMGFTLKEVEVWLDAKRNYQIAEVEKRIDMLKEKQNQMENLIAKAQRFIKEMEEKNYE